MKHIKKLLSCVLAAAMAITIAVPAALADGGSSGDDYALESGGGADTIPDSESAPVDYHLYFDGETGQLYKTSDISYHEETDSWTHEFSDPIEVPGAICEENKLTLTSDFRFCTTDVDGLYLGEGSTLYVPEGENPSIYSAVSGFELNDVVGGASGIFAFSECTLDIDGSLTVISGDGVNGSSWGVLSCGNLTITGTGSFNARGGNIVYDEKIEELRGDSFGIFSYGGLDISIAELNAVAGDAYGAGVGITCETYLTVSDGSHVKAASGKCGDAELSASFGCAVENLTVKDNSSMTASAAVSEGNYGSGLLIFESGVGNRKIELSNNSSLTVTSDGSEDCYGFYSISDFSEASMDESCTFTAEGQSIAAFREITGVSALADGKTVKYDDEKRTYVDADRNPVKKISFSALTADNFPFVDVAASDWFYNAVKAAYTEGLISGVTETEFAPNMTMTRGMLVAVIGRMGAADTSAASSTFTDVDSNAYYAPYVAWAEENGIVSGFEDGTFKPDESVTREETSMIIWRYLRHIGADVSIGENTNVLSFTDAAEISEYAFPAIQWACGAGVINGYPDGRLAPKAGITRAEFASMISAIALI